MTGSFDSTTDPQPIAVLHSAVCIVCESPAMPGALLCASCDGDPRHDLDALAARMADHFPVLSLARAAVQVAEVHGLSPCDRLLFQGAIQREESRRFEAWCGRAGRPRTERREEI